MFGSNPTSAFGQKPAFGGFGSRNPAQSSPFGNTFGQSQTAPGSATSQPAFGSASTPSFGFSSNSLFSQSSNDFGAASSPAFGNSPSPFGAQSTTSTFGSPGSGQIIFGGQRGGTRVAPYTTTNEADTGSVSGQTTTPGKLVSISAMPQYKEKSHEELRWEDYQLGDKATSAFGQKPAFGGFGSRNPAQSSPFGNTFGQSQTAPGSATSQPAFGAQSTTSTFGSPGFGQIIFGGQRGGTRVAPYTTTNEADTGSVSGQTTTPGKLVSISAMPQYKEKSHVELRWEDYQIGGKGGPNPASQQPAGGLFSQPAQSSPFGQTKPSVFGQTTPSVFGQTTPSAFGQMTRSAFGQTTAFGQASAANTFSSTYPSLFGSTASAFGGASSASPFGTSSSTAFAATPFGQASQPASLFGSTPSLGSSPAFGSSTPFGNTQSSRPFQSSTPAFGQATPAFGQAKERSHKERRWEDHQLGDKGGPNPASQQPADGLFSQPAQSSPFGQTKPSVFGQTRPSVFGQMTRSAFGQTTSAFGQGSAANTFSSTSPSLFGSTASAFGGASSASPFGTSSSPAFAATPFGQASQPASLFGSTPSLWSSPAFGSSPPFGNTQSSGPFQSSTPAFGQATPASLVAAKTETAAQAVAADEHSDQLYPEIAEVGTWLARFNLPLTVSVPPVPAESPPQEQRIIEVESTPKQEVVGTTQEEKIEVPQQSHKPEHIDTPTGQQQKASSRWDERWSELMGRMLQLAKEAKTEARVAGKKELDAELEALTRFVVTGCEEEFREKERDGWQLEKLPVPVTVEDIPQDQDGAYYNLGIIEQAFRLKFYEHQHSELEKEKITEERDRLAQHVGKVDEEKDLLGQQVEKVEGEKRALEQRVVELQEALEKERQEKAAAQEESGKKETELHEAARMLLKTRELYIIADQHFRQQTAEVKRLRAQQGESSSGAAAPTASGTHPPSH